jgi:L-malate glycosyltransferase
VLLPDSAGSDRRRRCPLPICFTVRELGLGGIERDVTKLAIRLDRSRFQPFVFTYKPEGPRYEELRKANVPVISFRFPSLLSGAAAAAAGRFLAFLRSCRVQIVHSFDPSAVFALPLARLGRIPLVLSSQLGHRDLHDGRTRRQLKMVDRLSDAVVVNCEALKRHLEADYGLAPGSIRVCRNGVVTEEFYPAQAPPFPELGDAAIVIGTLCVLRPEKNLQLLQAGFAKVRDRVPGAKLWIVGDGPELGSLRRNSQELGLGDSCVFTPAMSAVAPVLRRMDVFALTSRSEAFSNSLLEAMACRCAVVGSRVGGTPELIGEDETRGLLFQSEDVGDLSFQLTRLIKDVGLRKNLGQKAAQYARDTLNIEANVACMTSIYDELWKTKRLTQSSPSC